MGRLCKAIKGISESTGISLDSIFNFSVCFFIVLLGLIIGLGTSVGVAIGFAVGKEYSESSRYNALCWKNIWINMFGIACGVVLIFILNNVL